MQCRAIPYEGKEPYVFFSYCHKDADRVYPILEQMVRDGFRVWYDDGNHAGDDWLENIGQHLSGCAVCLAMLSENAEQSHNCRKEVSFAVQCGKKLLAVMLEKFAMTVGMRLQLSTIHYLSKNEYPSTAALLGKLYESDCLGQCRAVPGSIPMRSLEEEAPKPVEQQPAAAGVSSFLQHEIKAGQAEPVPQAAAPVETAREPEVKPEPAEKAPKAKPRAKLKVRAVPKTAPVKAVPAEPEKAAPPPVEEPEKAAAVEEPVAPAEEPVKAVAVEEPVAPVEDPVEAVEELAEAVEAVEELAEAVEAAPAQEPEAASEAENGEIRSVEVAVMAQQIEDSEKTVYTNRGTRRDEEAEAATVCADPNEDGLLIRLNTMEVHTINSALTRIGRSRRRCDFQIPDNTSVSNYHADLIYYSGSYYLKDVGSSNGTFVAGGRLDANEQTEIGNLCIFRISDEPILLICGQDAARCKEMGKLALLLNPKTGHVQLIGAEGLHLDRNHKWPDGTFSGGKISREHAVIEYEDGEFVLIDRESRNGTYHNETRIPAREKILLKDKDQIRLADSCVEFRITM